MVNDLIGGVSLKRLVLLCLLVLLSLVACNNTEAETSKNQQSQKEEVEIDTEVVEEESEEEIVEEAEQKVVNLIQSCDFESAMTLLRGKQDKRSRNLYNYAYARAQWDKKADLNAIYYIYPYYSGDLSKEIKEFVTGGNPNNCNRFDGPDMDTSEWSRFYKHQNKYYPELDPSRIPPRIGMTAEAALLSTWGEPNDINKTTTENGTSEQWVYNDNKYLYFEDGELTTIQE